MSIYKRVKIEDTDPFNAICPHCGNEDLNMMLIGTSIPNITIMHCNNCEENFEVETKEESPGLNLIKVMWRLSSRNLVNENWLDHYENYPVVLHFSNDQFIPAYLSGSCFNHFDEKFPGVEKEIL